MRRLIKIYDTTLRDGTQGEGVSFSMEDKVRLTTRLDAFGIHYIEGGWPGSNPKGPALLPAHAGRDAQARQARRFLHDPAGRRPTESDPNMRAIIESGRRWRRSSASPWDFHVTEALETTRDENVAMIRTPSPTSSRGWTRCSSTPSTSSTAFAPTVSTRSPR
jgi:2-isopropylmalate synthase